MPILTRSTVAALIAVAMLAPARATRAQQTAPAPCKSDSTYRKFDFWVGSWTVTPAGATQQVGTSRIDVVSGGCALLENWRDARGGEGKSLNTYDPALRQWRQFWVGQQGGVTDYARSEWNGSTISFYADVPAANGRPKATMRLSFTPISRDEVRQLGEISTDDGKTWKTQYDFHYHRAP